MKQIVKHFDTTNYLYIGISSHFFAENTDFTMYYNWFHFCK